MDPSVLNDEIDLLAGLALFAEFDHDVLKLIAFSADTRIVRAGDVLFRKGEIADAGYLMISGTVALDEQDNGGPSAALFGRGALIGQNALLAPIHRPATAVMRESGAVLKITRALMTRVLATYPQSALKLRQRFAEDFDAMIEDVQRATVALAKALEM
jgi:CRP-like cAMP-binding protein